MFIAESPATFGTGVGLIGQGDFEHLVEVRRRIGADEKHTQSTIGEADGGGTCQRGLADAALAGEEKKRRGSVQSAKDKH